MATTTLTKRQFAATAFYADVAHIDHTASPYTVLAPTETVHRRSEP